MMIEYNEENIDLLANIIVNDQRFDVVQSHIINMKEDRELFYYNIKWLNLTDEDFEDWDCDETYEIDYERGIQK